MRKRTRLSDRVLPNYTKGEEIMNMVTHIVGGGMGIIVLLLCVAKAIHSGSALAVIGSAIYGVSMIAVYTLSSIYHGLRLCTGKKVLQILDHCTIYMLIAGTYTPILLCAICPLYPAIGWWLLAAEWGLAILSTVLTAIDLKRYKVFSQICYIAMGWGIIFFLPQTMQAMTPDGFWLLLSGGVAYTIGAIIFGIGAKVHWMHSVFHIFVVVGSLLQFLAIFFYAL